MATLIGQNTFGSAAAYVGPIVVRLPESGMEFRLEVDLLINPDGTFNEIVGTPPDIRMDSDGIPERVTKEGGFKEDIGGVAGLEVSRRSRLEGFDTP